MFLPVNKFRYLNNVVSPSKPDLLLFFYQISIFLFSISPNFHLLLILSQGEKNLESSLQALQMIDIQDSPN